MIFAITKKGRERKRAEKLTDEYKLWRVVCKTDISKYGILSDLSDVSFVSSNNDLDGIRAVLRMSLPFYGVDFDMSVLGEEPENKKNKKKKLTIRENEHLIITKGGRGNILKEAYSLTGFTTWDNSVSYLSYIKNERGADFIRRNGLWLDPTIPDPKSRDAKFINPENRKDPNDDPACIVENCVDVFIGKTYQYTVAVFNTKESKSKIYNSDFLKEDPDWYIDSGKRTISFKYGSLIQKYGYGVFTLNVVRSDFCMTRQMYTDWYKELNSGKNQIIATKKRHVIREIIANALPFGIRECKVYTDVTECFNPDFVEKNKFFRLNCRVPFVRLPQITDRIAYVVGYENRYTGVWTKNLVKYYANKTDNSWNYGDAIRRDPNCALFFKESFLTFEYKKEQEYVKWYYGDYFRDKGFITWIYDVRGGKKQLLYTHVKEEHEKDIPLENELWKRRGMEFLNDSRYTLRLSKESYCFAPGVETDNSYAQKEEMEKKLDEIRQERLDVERTSDLAYEYCETNSEYNVYYCTLEFGELIKRKRLAIETDNKDFAYSLIDAYINSKTITLDGFDIIKSKCDTWIKGVSTALDISIDSKWHITFDNPDNTHGLLLVEGKGKQRPKELYTKAKKKIYNFKK